ncbi:unnamed protein product [Microthlaspi erraticum]|uniref:Amino acid transporter transmembrane domain-containing protein n=1 Tax=Microthlaspi erraticum TaxID=1685480 RepID=A0A6D2JTT7_9BRAS|nr:unnamed protein product [Microthlaspi erraticum]
MTVVDVTPTPTRSSSSSDDVAAPLLPTSQGDKDAYDEFNGASFSGAVFNLATTIIGAGIMALPATMKILGLVLGITMIVVMAFLTDASIEFLLRFIYCFMAIGILVCIVTFIGFIAAEAISGCCLCFYSILKTLVIILEAALVGYIAIDRHWEKDLPYDPTGELTNLRAFIEANIDICKWVGIVVVAVQLLSLLLALVLRAMVSPRQSELDEEDDFESRARENLLGPQANQTSSASSNIDNWRSRIREKYGLVNGQSQNPSV